MLFKRIHRLKRLKTAIYTTFIKLIKRVFAKMMYFDMETHTGNTFKYLLAVVTRKRHTGIKNAINI